jgi:hypothetical protein
VVFPSNDAPRVASFSSPPKKPGFIRLGVGLSDGELERGWACRPKANRKARHDSGAQLTEPRLTDRSPDLD